MKNIIGKMLLAALLLAPLGAYAQIWKWPMAGHKAGENIVCQPGSHIGKEYNCCNLFVGGEAGDAVLCPVDGIVVEVSLCYISRIGYAVSYYYDDKKTWDENLRGLDLPDDVDKQYVSGNLVVKIADGRKVGVSGLRGNYCFSKGQKVSASDTLGRLAWSYKGVHKPSVNISISLPNTVSDDPMAPFGLKSMFHLEVVDREDPLSVEKMREDLTVLEQAILEVYPSLNERMTDAEFHDLMESLRQSVTKPVPQMAPLQLIWFCHLLHDSHMTLLDDRFPSASRDFYIPAFYYSWVDDTMRVLFAEKQYKKYIGRGVKSIDGMSTEAYAKRFEPYVDLYDHDVQSKLIEELMYLSSKAVLVNYDATANSTSHIVFDDGEELDIPFKKYPFIVSSEGSPFDRMVKWRFLNVMPQNPDSVYTTRMLNDSTAYLSIRSFNMGEAKLDRIVRWIGQCKAANMIVDVRSNAGGDPSVMHRILACFAQKPLNRQRGSHLFVKKRDNIASMRYFENHIKEERLFADFVQLEGKPGYYSFDTVKTSSCIMPDNEHQYTGRVYVLTNGNSLSCATVFPAVLVRNRRGVSVGRETGSAYHYMTAFESADVCMPNTLRTITIPMVKVVFDTTVCARTPWGRGLLPDYELPLTYNEVTMGADGETDVMLEYALQLIADGKYLSEEDPFAEADALAKGSKLWLWISIALALLIMAISVLLLRAHRTTGTRGQDLPTF